MEQDNLVRWIKDQVKRVFWDRKNTLGLPSYHIGNAHHTTRPDLLVELNSGQWAIIEIEPGDEYKQIIEGIKQLGTFQSCVKDGMKITLDNCDDTPSPTYYFLMTNFSPEGIIYRGDKPPGRAARPMDSTQSIFHIDRVIQGIYGSNFSCISTNHDGRPSVWMDKTIKKLSEL